MSEIQAILQWAFQLFLTSDHGHAFLEFNSHLFFGVVARLVARDVSKCKQSDERKIFGTVYGNVSVIVAKSRNLFRHFSSSETRLFTLSPFYSRGGGALPICSTST